LKSRDAIDLLMQSLLVDEEDEIADNGFYENDEQELADDDEQELANDDWQELASDDEQELASDDEEDAVDSESDEQEFAADDEEELADDRRTGSCDCKTFNRGQTASCGNPYGIVDSSKYPDGFRVHCQQQTSEAGCTNRLNVWRQRFCRWKRNPTRKPTLKPTPPPRTRLPTTGKPTTSPITSTPSNSPTISPATSLPTHSPTKHTCNGGSFVVTTAQLYISAKPDSLSCISKYLGEECTAKCNQGYTLAKEDNQVYNYICGSTGFSIKEGKDIRCVPTTSAPSNSPTTSSPTHTPTKPPVRFKLVALGKECPDKVKIVLSKRTSDPATCAALAREDRRCGPHFEVRKDRLQCRCNPVCKACTINADSGGNLYINIGLARRPTCPVYEWRKQTGKICGGKQRRIVRSFANCKRSCAASSTCYAISIRHNTNFCALCTRPTLHKSSWVTTYVRVALPRPSVRTSQFRCAAVRDRATGCHSGERRIAYSEMRYCKNSICHKISKWAIVTGVLSSMDGKGYGCKLANQERSTRHSLCVSTGSKDEMSSEDEMSSKDLLSLVLSESESTQD